MNYGGQEDGSGEGVDQAGREQVWGNQRLVLCDGGALDR